MENNKSKIITLTDNAYNRINEIVSNAENGTIGIRISLKNKGCVGVSYCIDAINAVLPTDEVIEFDNFKIAINIEAFLFLIGIRLDYTVDKMRSGFVFENPNQIDACGCGESVKLISQ